MHKTNYIKHLNVNRIVLMFPITNFNKNKIESWFGAVPNDFFFILRRNVIIDYLNSI